MKTYNIILYIQAGTALIHGILREDMDYSSFPGMERIHCIRFDETRSDGEIEFTEGEPHLHNLLFTDPSPYADVFRYAKEAIEVAASPTCFYATRDNLIIGEVVYNRAETFGCVKYPRSTTPPAGFTSVAPEGELNDWQEWFWSGEVWVASPFPLTYVLSEGQQHMRKLLKNHYNELMNEQLREYNMWELSQDPNLENFTPADVEVHGHQTMLSYDNHLRTQMDSLTQTIDSATDVAQLYNIDLTLQP